MDKLTPQQRINRNAKQHADDVQRIVARQQKRKQQEHMLGVFLTEKYQAQQRKVGTYQAARNMRKQGFPLGLARAVLL